MLTTLHWVLLASLFLPFLTLLGILLIVRRIRSPVSDKLPKKPAGESLRKRLEELDEKVNDVLILTFFGPAVITVFVLLSNPSITTPGGSTNAGIIVSAIAGAQLLAHGTVASLPFFLFTVPAGPVASYRVRIRGLLRQMSKSESFMKTISFHFNNLLNPMIPQQGASLQARRTDHAVCKCRVQL
jgi:hypothetical protein